eukprot:903225-Pleurochrysis_carterae.AAC.1
MGRPRHRRRVPRPTGGGAACPCGRGGSAPHLSGPRGGHHTGGRCGGGGGRRITRGVPRPLGGDR